MGARAPAQCQVQQKFLSLSSEIVIANKNYDVLILSDEDCGVHVKYRTFALLKKID